MDFKDWYNFDGTISKDEYVKRLLIWILGCVVLFWIPILGQLACIALLVMGIAAVIRRLRSLDMNPLLTLLILIPLVGLIFIIWLAVKD